MADISPEVVRRLTLEGTFNVRDIGGYPTVEGGRTRWRMLLRADSLHRLSPDAQATLLDHGVRTIIDLRRPDEVADAPNVFAGAGRVAYHHLSLMGVTSLRDMPQTTLEDLYRHILDDRQAEVAAVLATLAAPGALPALVHCTAGKDRTGLITALVLSVAGVPPEIIAEDYGLTARNLAGDDFEATRQQAMARGHDWARYAHLLESQPEAMLATLAHLDARHGGVPAYLRAIGLRDEQIAALRQALVEPVPGPVG